MMEAALRLGRCIGGGEAHAWRYDQKERYGWREKVQWMSEGAMDEGSHVGKGKSRRGEGRSVEQQYGNLASKSDAR